MQDIYNLSVDGWPVWWRSYCGACERLLGRDTVWLKSDPGPGRYLYPVHGACARLMNGSVTPAQLECGRALVAAWERHVATMEVDIAECQ